MIADYALPSWATARRARRRHSVRPAVPRERAAPLQTSRWAQFWDDRQAVRLKVVLVIASLLAAALLEAPR
jgi:hypothetical protein